MDEIIAAREIIKKFCRRPKIKLPINVLELCERLHCTVKTITLTDFDGCHIRLRVDNRVLILLNRRAHRHRKRFTIAHEIGHIILGHMPSIFDGKSFIETRHHWQEIQANRFAAELLMPTPVLEKFGMLTPFQVSGMFDVSIEAARYKTLELDWTQERLEDFTKEQVNAKLKAMGL